jgi:hypothetical protein
MEIYSPEKKSLFRQASEQTVREKQIVLRLDADSCGSDSDYSMGCLWGVLVLLSRSLAMSTKFQLTLLLTAPQSFLLYENILFIWCCVTSAADTVTFNK